MELPGATYLTYTSIPRFHDAWGTSDTNVYVVGEAGTILHTTDGGATLDCNDEFHLE